MTAKAMERELAARAINYDCPTCGAKAGVRCRILTPNVTNPKLTKVDVRANPCPERAALAWPTLLNPPKDEAQDDPRSNGTAVVAPGTAIVAPGKSQRDWLATADFDGLYRAAVLGIKAKKPFEYSVKRADLEQMAAALATENQKVYVVTFFAAAALYDPTPGSGWRDREDAMDFLRDKAGVSPSNARLACDMVDIAAAVDIDEDTVGVPTLGQLNRIARANIKKLDGGDRDRDAYGWGWTKINTWVKRKGGWGNVTEAAISYQCQKIKDDAKAERRDRDAVLLPADPYDPPDAVVVEDDEPRRSAAALPPLSLTEEQRAERRKYKALAEVDDLTEMAGFVANLEEIPDGDEELLKRLPDIQRLADVAARLRAKATPYHDDLELPL